MEKMNISDIIYQFKNEVCYYNQMQLYSMLPSEKNYYLNQIEERTQDVIMQLQIMEKQDTNPILTSENTEIPNPNTSESEQKEFTLVDLAQFDGTNGKSAYVAVNGTIYDVTNIALWAGGRHNGLLAGKDLSVAFLGCHLGMPDKLEMLPKVGVLKK